jgi:hypothetical protein
MSFRSTIIAAALFAGAPAAFAQGSSDPIEVFKGPVQSGAWLRIRSPNGRIDVRDGTGPNVTVTAVKRLDDYDRADVKFDVRRDGANVTVCAITPSTRRCDADGYDSRGSDYDDSDRYRRRSARIDFTAIVPRGVRILASTGNGVVTVRNAGAEVQASSGNGEVSVLGANGRVRASSGNGDIEVDHAEGDVHASSGNGRIKVSTSMGPVSASTGNGRIEVDMRTISNPGDMSFSTGNGSITVRFPSNLSADIEANVPYRNFSTDFPIRMESGWGGRRIDGKIGNGGPRLRFSTGNGRVSIEKVN